MLKKFPAARLWRISIVALVLTVSLAAGPVAAAMLASSTGPGTAGAGAIESSRALALMAPMADNDDDDDGDDRNGNNNDNDGGGDDDDSDDENDNDGDDDDSDDGDDNDNDGNGGGGSGGGAIAQAQPARPAAPSCSTPGQEFVVWSDDGKVTARVFSNMPIRVRLSIRKPIDPASVPPVPGGMVDELLFQLLAEDCNGSGLARLPQEINLAVGYTDGDAAGKNEAGFRIALLDQGDLQWKDVPKQAADPSQNITSATVQDMGFYVLRTT